MRRALVAAGLAVTGLAGSVGFAGTASATADAVAAYNGVCGTGFRVVDHADIGTLGTVYLTWNDETGKNCVVTLRPAPGEPIGIMADIRQTYDTTGEFHANDTGTYTYYAGPVYIPARGECVTWKGVIGDNLVENVGHCGSIA